MYRPICLVSSLCLTALPVKAADNVLPMADFDEVKISVNTKNDFLASYMELNYPSSYAALAADVDCVACANGCSSGSETVDSGKCYTSTSSYLSCSTGQDVACYNTANWCDHNTYPYTASNVPSNSTVSGTSCSGYRGASGGQCAPNTNSTYHSDFKCNNNYVKVDGECKRAYSSCSAAGYYTDDNSDLYCEVTNDIYLTDGTTTTCYDNCHEVYADCSAAGYYDPDDYYACSGSDVDIYIDNLGATITCNSDCTGSKPASCEAAGYKSSPVAGQTCTSHTVTLSSGSKTCYRCVKAGDSCDRGAHSACVYECEEPGGGYSNLNSCSQGDTYACKRMNDCFDACNSEHSSCEPFYSDWNDDGTNRLLSSSSSSSSSSSGGGGNECAGLSADDCYSGATDAIRALCNDCRRAGFIY